MEFEALTQIEILFGLALVTVILLQRLVPSIVGFLAAGVVAGPHALGFIKDTHQVEQMAEYGVVLLLFTIGIEFSLKELMRIRHMVLLGGGLQLLLTMIAVTGIGSLWDFPVTQSLFFGSLVALSSTAVVMKLLIDAGEMDTPQGKTALGILIFQDLCVVPLMLFTIGIEFSLKELMRIRHMVLLGGGLQLLLTMLAVTGIGSLWDFPVTQSLFFGSLVALSSTAVVMKLLIDAGEMDTPQGKTALGILIFQDLCVVPLMLFTPFLAGGGDGITSILLVSAKAAAVVIAAHFGSRFVIPWIFQQVVKTRSRDLFILTIIFIALGTAWLTAKAGLSLALGAFIAGLSISESEYGHQALSEIMPFREALMSLFFISVGMLLKPAILLKYPLLLIVLVLGIIILKAVVATAAGAILGVPLRIAVLAGVSLAQVGEFSFVLSRAGLTYGLLTGETYQIFLVATIATMGLTPLCMKGAGPFSDRLTDALPRSWSRGRRLYAQNGDRIMVSDHVIIVGFGVNGRNLAKVLKNLHIPYVVIDTNPFTVPSEKKRGEPILFGDGSRPEILEQARIGQARCIVIAISDAAASRRIAAVARGINKSVHLIVRTRYLLEMEPLFALGVNEVIPEEFETSVEILSRVLRTFLMPQDVIESCIADVRRGGYEMLRSAARRHSHAVGIAGFLSGAEIGSFRVHHEAPIKGESLREGLLRRESGATVVAVKRGEVITPNPDSEWELLEGDVALLLGTPEQLRKAAKLFEKGR